MANTTNHNSSGNSRTEMDAADKIHSLILMTNILQHYKQIVKVNHSFDLEQCPVTVPIVYITNKTNTQMPKTPVIYPTIY
uniref:Uncharacterized protein n=1 Tax=Solanum tuberosum TaxID=4113 RepID=M1AXV6_SOLTU